MLKHQAVNGSGVGAYNMDAKTSFKDHAGQKGKRGNLLIMHNIHKKQVTEIYKLRINNICSNSRYKFSYWIKLLQPYNRPEQLAEANIIGEVFDHQTRERLAKKETGWLKYDPNPDGWSRMLLSKLQIIKNWNLSSPICVRCLMALMEVVIL